MSIQAKTALFTLEGSDHWIIDTSKKLAKPVSLQGFLYFKDGNVSARFFFGNVKNVREVTEYVKAIKHCKVDVIAKSPEGIIASIKFKEFPLDKAVKAIQEKTHSKLWINSNPDDLVNVYVQSPWPINVDKITQIFKKFDLQLKCEPRIMSSDMEVATLVDDVELKFDETDKKIAKTLLIEGYYSSPRPKGINQEKLAAKIGISKPTLEKRLARIESVGIQHLFGIRPFTKNEKDASLTIFKKKLIRK